MIPDKAKCELSHLYFNPTTNISKFLDQLLRPTFDEKCKTTTVIDDSSLIEALDQYLKRRIFKSSTLFCTIDIRNLYTILSQGLSLDILGEFLQTHEYSNYQRISLHRLKRKCFRLWQTYIYISTDY